MCVLSIKVPIQKKSGNLSYAPCTTIADREKTDLGTVKITFWDNGKKKKVWSPDTKNNGYYYKK